MGYRNDDGSSITIMIMGYRNDDGSPITITIMGYRNDDGPNNHCGEDLEFS